MLSYANPLLSEMLWANNWRRATVTGTTTFTLAGDFRDEYQVNVAIQVATDAGAITYVYVQTATFASNLTTVTVQGGVLGANGGRNVRASVFDGDNSALGRRMSDLEIYGAVGPVIVSTNPRLTMRVTGANTNTAAEWRWDADNNGNVYFGFASSSGVFPTANRALQFQATPNALIYVQANGKLQFRNMAASADKIVIDLDNGYAISQDNVGALGATSRVCITSPTSGEILLGPKATNQIAQTIRLRASRVVVEQTVGGGPAQQGDVWHSLNFTPGDYVAKGKNGTWSDTPFPVATDANTPGTAWTRYTSTTPNTPSGAGLMLTIPTVAGDNFNPITGYTTTQLAITQDAANPALQIRQSVNNGAYGAWQRFWTSKDFALGDYVPMSGNVTVLGALGVTGNLAIRPSGTDSFLQFFTSTVGSGVRAARINVTGGVANTQDTGSMVVNTGTLVVSANQAGGITLASVVNVGGNLTVSGAEVNMLAAGFTFTSVESKMPQQNFFTNGQRTGLFRQDTSLNFELYQYDANGTNPNRVAFWEKSTNRLYVNNFQAYSMTVATNAQVNGAFSIGQTLTVGSSSTFNAPVTINHNLYVHRIIATQNRYDTLNTLGSVMSYNDGGEYATYFTNVYAPNTSGGYRFTCSWQNGGPGLVAYITAQGTIASVSDVEKKIFGDNLDVETAINFVRLNRARYFKWKRDGLDDVGFGAQWVAANTPYLAEQIGDTWGLSYQKMAVYHHEVLNYLLPVPAKLASLDADVQTLAHQLDQAVARIAELEAELFDDHEDEEN